VLVVVVHKFLDLRSDTDFLQVVGVGDVLQSVRPVGCSLKPVHTEALFPHHSPNLVVLALVKLDVQPSVCVLPIRHLYNIWPILPSVHHVPFP